MNSFNDSIWDEHRWEQHLNSLQVGLVKRKTFMNSGWGENEPVWMRFLKEYDDIEEALECFLDDELTFEEAYFPEDPDENEDDDEIDDEIFGKSYYFDDPEVEFDFIHQNQNDNGFTPDPAEYQAELDSLFDDDDEALEDDDFWLEMDEELEGEEWKKSVLTEELMHEEQIDPDDPFYCYINYDELHELSLYFLLRTRLFPEYQDEPVYLEFMSELLQSTTKYAAGLAFEVEHIPTLGAVITYFKSSITHLNKSITLLTTLKNDGIISPNEYNQLTKRFFELRNDIGIMIQDMRMYLSTFIK